MRRIAMIAGCIFGSCVVGMTAAATASAAAPEFGKCVQVTPKTGEYSGKYCLAPAGGKGSYDWLPAPGEKKKVALNVEGSTLRSASGREIKCESGEGEGEYTSAKTTAITKLIFKNCKVAGAKTLFESFCQNIGAFRGEVTASELVGELGYIEHAEKIKVGLDIKPKLGKTLASFECGGASVVTEHGMGTGTLLEVEGSVIGRVKPIDKPLLEQLTYFVAKGGVQMPEQFEGGQKDTLTELVGLTKTPEPSTFSGTAETVNEEPIEVKGK